MVTGATIAVVLVVLGAEWLHARRIRRVAHLAFGGAGRPAAWVRAVPLLRAVSLGAIAFGAMTLLRFDPTAADRTRSPRASKRVLICLDVSPSMYVEDAGPQGQKTTRARWAGQIMQELLDRVGASDSRITLVAFYTKAIPVLTDTNDMNLVLRVLSGMPYYRGFEPGETDIASGINAALKHARPWGRRSATLVVISDGDAESSMTVGPLPASIADVLVVGVGDTRGTSLLGSRASRQDATSLKLLAARLGGQYFDGNRGFLPTRVIHSLAMTAPQPRTPWDDRERGLAALAGGALLFAAIGPALALFGISRLSRREERSLKRDATRVTRTVSASAPATRVGASSW